MYIKWTFYASEFIYYSFVYRRIEDIEARLQEVEANLEIVGRKATIRGFDFDPTCGSYIGTMFSQWFYCWISFNRRKIRTALEELIDIHGQITDYLLIGYEFPSCGYLMSYYSESLYRTPRPKVYQLNIFGNWDNVWIQTQVRGVIDILHFTVSLHIKLVLSDSYFMNINS